MRISVTGDSNPASVLRGYLAKADYHVTDVLPTYTIHLEQRGTRIIVDGVDSELERHIINCIAELTEKQIVLQRAYGVQSDRAIHVTVPEDEESAHAVELGVLRGVMKTTKHGAKKPWYRALFMVLLLCGMSRGQDTSPTTGGSSGSTTVTGNVTVVQPTGTNLHTVCDSGCGGAATFADAAAFTFSTTPVGLMGAVVDDVATNAVAENSAGAPRMTGQRILYFDLSKSAANTNKFLVTADAVTFASPQHVINDANTAVIGHVIADTGSTTAVTGNVAVTNSGLTNIDVLLSTRTKPADQQHVLLDANSGVDIGKLTANQSVNVAQVNGVTTSTGTGIMGTGVQRIAIASDNDPLTVKQATAANLNATVVGTGTFVTQSTLAAETTKVIGTVRATGNIGGVMDTTQNATQTANSLSIACAFTSTPNTITTANQGAVNCNSKGELLTQLTDGITNVAVIAGTTALKTDLSSVAGTATSTAASGVMKVGIVGGAAGANVDGAAAGTLPANVIMAGTIENNLPGRVLQCDKSAQVVGAAAATTAIVAASGSTTIYVCTVTLQGAGAAGTARLVYGTGATCGTGTTNITPAWNTQLQSATVSAFLQFGTGQLGYLFKTIASQALCITMATASATTNVFVTYAQF